VGWKDPIKFPDDRGKGGGAAQTTSEGVCKKKKKKHQLDSGSRRQKGDGKGVRITIWRKKKKGYHRSGSRELRCSRRAKKTRDSGKF